MYEIFEKLLNNAGITIYKFCKDTGVSESTIYTWKRKGTECSAKTGKAVCEYFGVSMDYLMSGEDTKSENIDFGYRYYIDEETAKTAQDIYNNDKVLFDVYRTVDKDRLVEFAKKLAELRKLEEGDE